MEGAETGVGWMEGSDSGALVPSDTIMEVETWVKLSNFPAEFLTAEAISLIVSSFGSAVASDEDTYEKVENHKRPPKLRRKLHSRKTFVTIWVRVSVTKPLPSRLTVACPKGREYFIRLDFDPTPKVCLLCLGAGHFDFECCGTDKDSVEIIAEAGVGSDGFCADFHGEQGAATTVGLHSYEDSTVVEAALMVDSHFLPAASCDIGAAAAPDLMPLLPATDYGVQGTLISDGVDFFEDATVVEAMKFPAATCDVGDAFVGVLEALHSFVDGVFEQPLEERTAAGLEMQPLLPAPIVADGSEGTFISDGFVCCEAPPLVEVVLEVSPHCFPPASCEFGAANLGDLETVQTLSDSFDDDPLVGNELAADPLATVGDSIATDLQAMIFADPCIVDEQLSGVFHKWRDFTDDQGLSEDGSGTGVGLLGVEVQDFSPVVEADLVENFLIIEQLFSVVNSPRKHHKWRDKSVVLGLWCVTLDEQGKFAFGKLDLLQMLSRLVWNLAATYYEQVCFKIHHKWRDKGY